MIHSICQRKIMLTCICVAGIFIAATNMAWAKACSVDCLRVFSIELLDRGTSIHATVKLTDESGAGGGARSTVVHGVWKRPDGSTFDQYANIGTRLRAEFNLYTAGKPGKYKLTVAGATKTGYTFDPANSTRLSKTINISGPVNELPVATADATTVSVSSIINFHVLGSADPDGTILNYLWDFGDGSYSAEKAPQHAYSSVGNFTATLTVSSGQGASASSSLDFIVVENIADCTSNCLSIERITMSYKSKADKVKGKVRLLDENGGFVGGAAVHAVWTLPDGSAIGQRRKTRSNSQANFSLPADIVGTYTLTVTDVSKTGYTLDLDSSGVLTGTIENAP